MHKRRCFLGLCLRLAIPITNYDVETIRDVPCHGVRRVL
jgi:hypothetical protein